MSTMRSSKQADTSINSINSTTAQHQQNGETLQELDGKEVVTLERRSSLLTLRDVHKIVVGVDFGTTYTGVSWVETAGHRLKTISDVHVIRDWPGPGRDSDYAWKTPSRIAYAKEGGMQRNCWGFGVTPRMRAYTWMKLLLDPEQASKYDDPSLTSSEGQGVLALPPNLTAIDVCGDYLANVAIFAYDVLKQKLSPDVLSLSPLEFWFTVPAVWSDKAKNDTLRVAQQAADKANVFGNAPVSTFLIAEPEAAAVATISALTEGGARQQIKVGDNLLVCDCGGGTVDITTYEILSLEPQLEFKEILVGTGGKCGSTYIDRLFIKWMERHFGGAYTTLSWEKRGPTSRFMKDFEGHKRDFGRSGDITSYYELELVMNAKDSAYYDRDESLVKLYYTDLQEMFDPVVKKILKLIDGQLEKGKAVLGKTTIKTIILVGGFGDSRYLNDAVRRWGDKKGSIRVICPDHPQAAIVRGAALSGLHSLRPTNRLARRHYGFTIDNRFDKLRHDPKHGYIRAWNGLKYAKGYVEWSLRKGDVVDESTKIIHKVSDEFDVSKVLTLKTGVYCCDLDDAPAHRTDNGTKKLAIIESDFSNVDLSACEQRMVNGRQMVKILFEISVEFGSKLGVLCFSTKINGEVNGSTNVSFDGRNQRDSTGLEMGSAENVRSCVLQ